MCESCQCFPLREDATSNLVVAAHPKSQFLVSDFCFCFVVFFQGWCHRLCSCGEGVLGEFCTIRKLSTFLNFASFQVVHKWCYRPGPASLIPSDSSPFLPCHNSKSEDQNNMSNSGHPQPQKYIYRCRVFHRASAYSNTSASTPQTPGLCLSLNIYFQRINARGRQVLAPRQKGDIRNSNTGVQTQIFVPLTAFRRQRYLCFRVFFFFL